MPGDHQQDVPGSGVAPGPKAVAVVSGGLDSTVMLWWLLDRGYRVEALTVDYGQRHIREIDHALEICSRADVSHQVLALPQLRSIMRGSSQTDDSVDVPDGHYTDESMKATVVPNRNMILLALATALAVSEKAESVAYAAHAGDHSIYPDCRPEFADIMGAAMWMADWHRVKLLRPFIAMTKADIIRVGDQLGVPMKLTWSCYRAGDKHCGTCGTCVERREAFKQAGIKDPTVYE